MWFNKPQCQRYFDNLKMVSEEKKFSAHRMLNMDESGIISVTNKIPKVISPKDKRLVYKVVSAERSQTITAVCCMNPVGCFVPPVIFFPRKRMKPELFKDAPGGTFP
jgi:hypothetical protein